MTEAITKISNAFYDTGLLVESAKKEEQPKTRPVSSSSTVDECDKIKEQWAFNMPCVLLVNGRSYWSARLKAIYELIYKDVLISVRKSLAAGLIELAKLIEVKSASNED